MTCPDLVVDQRGIPLAGAFSAANIHDSLRLEEVIDAIPEIVGPRGRPGCPRPRDCAADCPMGNRVV